MLLLAPLALASGTMLPAAPAIAPGRIAGAMDDPVGAARAAQAAGDAAGEARAWTAWIESGAPNTVERAGAWMAIGYAERRRGREAAAAAAFDHAARLGTPLAADATWESARSDLAGGLAARASAACGAYASRWPTGPHVEDCALLVGDAAGTLGAWGIAIGAYGAWLDRNPGDPRAELARLGLARATAHVDRDAGVAALVDLSLDHRWHPTGALADHALAELGASVPDDVPHRTRRADELLRCGERARAWAAYEALAPEPEAGAWVVARSRDFVVGTRHWDELARLDKPDDGADLGTVLDYVHALEKGGRWRDATKTLRDALGRLGALPDNRVELARDELLAEEWADARADWDLVDTPEAHWLAAYAAYRKGDTKDAAARLQAVIDEGGDFETAARYYTARLLRDRGKTTEANAAFRAVAERTPTAWYGILARLEADGIPADRTDLRDGRWPGAPPPTLDATPPGPRVHPAALPVPVRADPARSAVDWSRVHPIDGVPSAPFLTLRVDAVPAPPRPDSRTAYAAADLDAGRSALNRLAAVGGEATTGVPVALAYAAVGLYDRAGPLVGDTWTTLGPGAFAPTPDTTFTAADWLRMFAYAGDAHDALTIGRLAMRRGTPADPTDPWADPDARRIGAVSQLPTPWFDTLARYAPLADLDPLLGLAIMRQESIFDPHARSWVGALGLIQVMPRTGARIASLLHVPRYAPSDLLEPEQNLRFGTWYLGQLVRRFDGALPLAIASYNGGPHNVSAWLAGRVMRLDDFVELIPFPETRDYAKKVTGWYAGYVEAYAPAGTRVVPGVVAADSHPDGIDF